VTYRLAADALVVLHFGFVVFVLLGGLLILRWPRLIWLHLPAVAWGAFVEFSHRVCPLTPLENQLRVLGGEAGYSGGFIERYLLPILYPADLTAGLQILLGGIVVLVNLAIYLLIWRRWKSRSGSAAGSRQDMLDDQ
jgi:hypothetical protein